MEIHGSLHTFSLVDYAIFVASLVLSLAIGLYYSFCAKQENNDDFLMAGRNMPPFPVALSLLASFISAITVLALPAEVYYNGLQFATSIFWNCVAIIAVGTTLMPLFYNLKVTSIYEYLQLRYQSRLIRTLATLTFMIKILLYMAVVLYTPALALNVVTPLSTTASILTVGAICSVYTGFGGLRAVLWTDVFQVFMMVAGIAAIVIQGCIQLGGVAPVWTIAEAHGRTKLFDFKFDPFIRVNFWSMMIGGTVGSISLFGCSQLSVQRYLSMRSYKEARWALYSNIPMKIVISGLAYFSGLVVFAVYVNCDPKAAGLIDRPDQIMPYYVMDMLGYITGLPGLFVSCVFAASLSSLSSGLNALAACTWEDFISMTTFGKWLEKRNASLYFNKGLALSYGVISVGCAFFVGEIGTIIDAMITIMGAITGPILAAFVAAIFIPWCNRQGMTAGIIVGYITCGWLAIGSMSTGNRTINPPLSLSIDECPADLNITYTPPQPQISPLDKDSFEFTDIYRISFFWYTTLGCIIALIVALPISIITGNQDFSKLDNTLVHPWLVDYLQRKQKENEAKMSAEKSKYEMKGMENGSYTYNPPE